ncbi:transmembrane protein 275-like [Anguilla rostrata]|uniref:transmembrane protein 275-like n=1 Tax=Anguilla anguilla TaxID=7936 RepID=UPI0015B35EF0|nr:transmembrane protein 275-like [Anguilla anguilla]XP_035277177.1 transmembrane protein 275-like [Anguilla anguilla]
MFTDKSSGTSVPKKAPKKKTRPQGLPSPALCCACGLCIMLAGINITLVGAFAFGTLLPAHNPPIIIGPVLLLVALAFFGACCVCSRRPPAQGSRKPKGGGGGMGLARLSGAAFEIETSEHTLQDTTAVQLSPTNSPSSSRASSPAHEPPAATAPAAAAAATRSCKLFTMETNSLTSACYSVSGSDSGGGAVKLNLPRDPPPPSAEGC